VISIVGLVAFWGHQCGHWSPSPLDEGRLV
jgi:hypothetical protein